MSQSDRNRKNYWRSLDELSGTPEFEQLLHREFPVAASEFPEGVSRRRWLQLMGASLALGAAGCRYQEEVIATFTRRPEGRIPGETRKFATTIESRGVGIPVMAISFDGRPIKLDANAAHPDGVRGSSAELQAAVLDLYDPDRLRAPSSGGAEATWEAFFAAWKQRVADGRTDGARVAVLAQRSSSPTRIALLGRLREAMPALRYFEYDPISNESVEAGVAAAFGAPYRLKHELSDVKVLVSIDADPLGRDIDGVRNAHRWVKARDVARLADDATFEPARLYAVESQMSPTGMVADHRLPLKSTVIPGFVGELIAAVDAALGGQAVEVTGEGPSKVLAAIVDDLVRHAGRGAIVIGGRQAPEVQAAVHALNVRLGNVGPEAPIRPIERTDSASLDGIGSIADLVAAIGSGAIDTLVVLDGNPVYDGPADLKFAEAYAKVETRIHLASIPNETSRASTWQLPETHPLEAWGDAISFDGTYCLAQPLIAPLWGGLSAIELLDRLAGGERSGEELVREQLGASDRAAWRRAVHDGFVPGTAATPVAVSVADVSAPAADPRWREESKEQQSSELEVVLLPAATLFDGRHANNGWLQECPDGVTKITWGNAALFAPSTAEKYGVRQNTIVEVKVGETAIELPVHIVPGQARGSIGIALGYGRTEVGVVGGSVSGEIETVGVDAYPLHRTGTRGVLTDVSVRATDRPHELACTQDHHAIDELGLQAINNRVGKLIREGNWSDYRKFVLEPEAWLHEHEHHGSDHSHDAGSSHEHPEGAEGAAVAHAEQGDHSEDGHAEGSHEEGHSPHWPYHHEHFPGFDLNPGPAYDPKDPKWGMAIDLDKCVGCMSCVVACQSENNIPVVGRDQVIRGRLMHWLRVDRYYVGEDYDEPQVMLQPLTCHHCENAPCEQVCPVAATVHSDEGLNDMVYNRCIGTRYCANNCPYKVRRFNYLNYSEAVTFIKYPWADKLDKANRALRNLVMNPEVTIRSRGVMEKCTYCVQRIQNGKIAARREGRSLGPDEITTACQDACTTGAIVFGDLRLAESPAAKGHADSRAYELLGELNVRARTRYLSRVRNPHPALQDAVATVH